MGVCHGCLSKPRLECAPKAQDFLKGQELSITDLDEMVANCRMPGKHVLVVFAITNDDTDDADDGEDGEANEDGEISRSGRTANGMQV
ncbi:hypothetical protein TcWFU_010318 [Taenia crassiceps]|uniref:Uncharacterized protein n=1 Tax=Taenia crassiceps TaxID=6207 RepID=A0ABR4QTQ3_9CEST